MNNSKTPNEFKADSNRLLELAHAMGPTGKEAIERINQIYSEEIKSLPKDEQKNWSKLVSTINSHIGSGRYGFALFQLFGMGYSLGKRITIHTEKKQKEIVNRRKELPLINRNSIRKLVKEQILATASRLHKIEENKELDLSQLAELVRNEFKSMINKGEVADPNDDSLFEEIRAEIPEVRFYEHGTKKHDAIADWIRESDLKVKKPKRGRRKLTN